MDTASEGGLISMKNCDIILLVEDNSDDVVFMKRASKQAGIVQSFKIAEDGQIAIDYLNGTGPFADRAEYPLPCLVLLDLKLPYKNGHEVLKWIRQHESLKTLPVIMFTTSAEHSDIEAAYQLGANAYLVKPANLNELIGILKALKMFWLEHNVLPQVGQGHVSIGSKAAMRFFTPAAVAAR